MNAPFKILMVGDNVADAGQLQDFLSQKIPGSIVKKAMTETVFQKKMQEFDPDIVLSQNSTVPNYSQQASLSSQEYPPVMMYVNNRQAASIGHETTIAAVDLPVAKNIDTKQDDVKETMRFDASILNALGQPVIATDIYGMVKYWNIAAEKTYGWLASEAMGKSIVELIAPQQSKEQRISITDRLLSGHSWTGDFLVRHKNGSIFPVEVIDSPLFDTKGNINGIIGISFDISEKKKAAEIQRALDEKMADQKIQEQKKISRAIIKAQEQEKNRLGKELHDNINQILASAKIFLSLAARKNAELKQLLQHPIELLNNSIEEIRNLTYKQVTPIKNIQLEQQIEKLLLTPTEEGAINIAFNFSIDETVLSDELKLNIYRIIQEQLINILKHAAAKNISITLEEKQRNVCIIIRDDGRGFDTSITTKGIGITNMKNRVESYNGRLEIKSSPGSGCVVDISFPLL